MEKKKRMLFAAGICVLILLVAFLSYTFYPLSIMPDVDYSSVIADYVLINGERITLNENQTSEIVGVLEKYKMHRTYGNYKITEYMEYNPCVYMVLIFRDEYGSNIAGASINLSDEFQLASNATLYSQSILYKKIYNGRELKDKLLSIILQ